LVFDVAGTVPYCVFYTVAIDHAFDILYSELVVDGYCIKKMYHVLRGALRR
jgi:hypothetical protein